MRLPFSLAPPLKYMLSVSLPNTLSGICYEVHVPPPLLDIMKHHFPFPNVETPSPMLTTEQILEAKKKKRKKKILEAVLGYIQG